MWFFQAGSVLLNQGVFITKKHDYIYGGAFSYKAWHPDYHL